MGLTSACGKMATLDSAYKFSVLYSLRCVSVFKGTSEARKVITLVDTYLGIWYQLVLQNV